MPNPHSPYRQPLPSSFSDQQELLKKIINTVNNLLLGQANNVGTVTLTAGAASTVITVPQGKLGVNSAIFFTPTTANAAAEIGAGTMYLSARSIPITTPPTASTFTITHANNAQTDRTFYYMIVG